MSESGGLLGGNVAARPTISLIVLGASPINMVPILPLANELRKRTKAAAKVDAEIEESALAERDLTGQPRAAARGYGAEAC